MSGLVARRWSEVEGLIDDLMEMPAHEREPWLATRCPDLELRRAVLEFAAREPGPGALEQLIDQIAPAAGGAMPAQVGPYRVLRMLGQGGMATVYLAERRTAEFTQRVALKLSRTGVYSAEDQALFRREQRIHAALEHPNIARMLDSGITSAGVPYFALEYVPGRPLTEHCDQHRLGLAARVALFLTVCRAVEHAHRNLVVHRDLKPSNILVTDAGEPKLLDFGIAKLLSAAIAGQGDRAETWTTDRMSPAYAAPEQVAGGRITTATDVYALGIVLAELLAGARPERDAAGETARPSELAARVPPEVAQRRGLAPRALAAALRGDLDAIVARSLAPDPQRRYAGAGALGEDLERYLAGEPVLARAASTRYLLARFARRHRLLLGAGALVALTLVVASTVALREAGAARAAARRATAEAQRADAVKDFVVGMFGASAPGVERPPESADEVLERGRERSLRQLEQQPEAQVDILLAIGDMERRRGKLANARSALTEATRVAESRLGAGDARALHAHVRLAELDFADGRFREAEAGLGAALEAARAGGKLTLGDEASALNRIAIARLRLGRAQEAYELAHRTTTMLRGIEGPTDLDLSDALLTEGDVLTQLGRSAEALAALQEASARERAKASSGTDDLVQRATILGLSGVAQVDLGRYVDAEASMREALALARRVYSGPTQQYAIRLNDLGQVLLAQGKLEEALALQQEALTQQRSIYEGDNPNMATTMLNIGRVQTRLGRASEAEPLLRDALAMVERTRGSKHPRYYRAQAGLAECLVALGRYEEAGTLLAAALAGDQALKSPNGRDLAADHAALAELWLAQGRGAEAVAAARASIAAFGSSDPAHPRVLDARLRLARALAEQGDARAAEAEIDAARRGIAALAPRPLTLEANALRTLAHAQRARGDLPAARASVQAGLALLASDPSVAVPSRAQLEKEID